MLKKGNVSTSRFSFFIIGLFLVAIPTRAEADTYYSTYGSSRNHNEVVVVGTHSFQVDNIAARKNTEWYVNGVYTGSTENDYSGLFAVDPQYTRYIGTATKIEALVYDQNWNYEEKHTWNLSLAKPDLIIQDIAISPISPIAGQSATITATVKNQGNANASQFYIAYYVDNVYIGDDVLSFGLNAGNTNEETITYTAPISGAHTVKVVADYTGQISESNEANNTYSESYSWSSPSMPDLIIQDIAISPTTPIAGQSVTITTTVKNQGNANASQFYIAYYVDNVYIGDDVLSFGLNAGNTNEETISYTATTSGTRTVKVVADYTNQINESNETNNTYSENFTWNSPPMPDLTVIDILMNNQTTLPSVVAGQNVRLDFIGKNIGDVTSKTSIGMKWWWGTSQNAKTNEIATGLLGTINGLAINESETETDASWIIPNLSPGTYWLTAEIDYDNKQNDEKSESNNIRSESFSIPGPSLASFGGIVTDASTGDPISGANVSWGGYNTTTNSSGSYSFDNVPCQTATLTVSKSGYQTYSQSHTPPCLSSSAKNVSLTANLASFGGTVTDATTGNPISGASVSWGGYNATTNSSGSYSFNNVPCQSSTLTVNKNGYQTFSESHTPPCLSSSVKNISLTANFASFGGIVTDASTGDPISGANVSWGGYNTTTNSSGSYSFDNVPCQTATLTVSKSGYQTFSESHTPPCLSSSAKNVTLTANLSELIPPSGVPGNSAYPIIFIHGLDSNEETWTNFLNTLSAIWGPLDLKNIFHCVLNAYGGMTNIKGEDGILGTNDDDVLFPQRDENGAYINQLTDGKVFAINFQNFWDQDQNDPRIRIHNSASPGFLGLGESDGNESSIFKQGYALSKMIQAVLMVTSAEKVILVGHSMGGLAAREYLQREENGQHTWWIDQSSPDGHKVAKLVTFGTPHLGSNFGNILAKKSKIEKLAFPNQYSEATRDLRYSYSPLDEWLPDPNLDTGIYLFGGLETFSVIAKYHNADVNCDGDALDEILGINDGNASGRDNTLMPLPSNLLYTWITSNSTGTGDGIVKLERQYLSSIGDTLLTNRNHSDEPADYYSLIRGLDESNFPDFAYELTTGKIVHGFITYQQNMGTSDDDYFKVPVTNPGVLSVTVSGENSGVESISIYDQSMNLINGLSVGSFPNTLSVNAGAGLYHIKVSGTATATSWRYAYGLLASLTQVTPETPTLVSPSNGATNVLTSPTLSWNVSNGAISYHLQVSTSIDFSSLVYDKSGITSTSSQISGLAYNTAYYWRVNATNNASTSDYSTSWDFTTTSAPIGSPSVPTLISPTDDATGVSTMPTLTWGASTGATSYCLQVSADSNFALLVYDQNAISITSEQVPDLAKNTNYYWRVNGTNIVGTSDWSNTWHFITLTDNSKTWSEDFNSDAFSNGAWLRSDGSVSINTDDGWLSIGSNGDYDDFAEKIITISLPLEIETRMRLVSGGLNYTLPYMLLYYGTVTNQWITIGYLPDQNFGWAFGIQPNHWLQTHANAPSSENQWWTIKARIDSSGGKLFVKNDTQSSFSQVLENSWTIPDQITRIRFAQPWDAVCNVDYVALLEGTITEVNTTRFGSEIPNSLTLYQNYPNPFNPSTKIQFGLPSRSVVTLKVFNMLGQEIETLVEGEYEAGTYSVDWQTNNLPAGVYFYRLQTEQFIETKKMILLK